MTLTERPMYPIHKIGMIRQGRTKFSHSLRSPAQVDEVYPVVPFASLYNMSVVVYNCRRLVKDSHG